MSTIRVQITYHNNSAIKVRETYSNGMRNGPCEIFYENGQLQASCTFVNDEVFGEVREFYENGAVMAHHNVTNDINTFYTEFYQDGQQSLDCKFIDAII